MARLVADVRFGRHASMAHARAVPDPLGRRAFCLAHPLRRDLMQRFAEGPTSPARIAERVSSGLSHVSYHTDALAEAGVIRCVRERQVRGAIEHIYELLPYEEWEPLVGFLHDVVGNATPEGRDVGRPAVRAGGGLELDVDGWLEARAVVLQAKLEVDAIASRARERQDGTDRSERVRASFGAVLTRPILQKEGR